jgi:hypothetical protein
MSRLDLDPLCIASRNQQCNPNKTCVMSQATASSAYTHQRRGRRGWVDGQDGLSKAMVCPVPPDMDPGTGARAVRYKGGNKTGSIPRPYPIQHLLDGQTSKKPVKTRLLLFRPPTALKGPGIEGLERTGHHWELRGS